MLMLFIVTGLNLISVSFALSQDTLILKIILKDTWSTIKNQSLSVFFAVKFYESRSLKNHEQKCALIKGAISNEKTLVERRNKKLNVVRNFNTFIKKEKTVRITLPPFLCLPNQQACLAPQSVYSPENGVWLKPITVVNRNTPNFFVLPTSSRYNKNLNLSGDAKDKAKYIAKVK